MSFLSHHPHRSFTIALATTFALSTAVSPILPAQQRSSVEPQQRKLTVAVMDFDARSGIEKGEAATLSDAFQSEINSLREFTLVDRQRIKQILEEQGFQQSEACSQVECLVEAGKILKVERMFAGTIGKVGTMFNVNIQVIDISTAQILANLSRQYRGDIEDLLSEIIPNMARELASDLTGKKIEPISSGKGSWLWYALGAVVVGGGATAAVLLKPTKASASATSDNLPSPPVLPF